MGIEHWLYLAGVVMVILTMIMRRNVVIPCVVFTFVIGLIYTSSFIGAMQTVFTASLVAGTGLFNIFLIIGIMLALLRAVEREGADRLLVVPLKKIMRTPLTSYVVIIGATTLISLFFWPTPAAPLLGALLIPVAVRVGLPPHTGGYGHGSGRTGHDSGRGHHHSGSTGAYGQGSRGAHRYGDHENYIPLPHRRCHRSHPGLADEQKRTQGI
jgi:hypothetical protein